MKDSKKDIEVMAYLAQKDGDWWREAKILINQSNKILSAIEPGQKYEATLLKPWRNCGAVKCGRSRLSAVLREAGCTILQDSGPNSKTIMRIENE